MSKQSDLIKKLYQTLNLMVCESKIPKNYGTADGLTAADIDFLKCIQRKKHAKASDISSFLGVTNGAVTQLAKKLERKGYLEPYRIPGNNKEKYYRLTCCGETACEGFDTHYSKIITNIQSYIDSLDSETVDQIAGLFDVISDSLAIEAHCSVKHGFNPSDCQQEAEKMRCEKCQKIY
ncbi:MAG: MarR family transcriptional regulator [Oscillospiraceae bacterium]|nr:MarR family transcriptional regulator [Oscillospiraceae bacterium]